MVENNYNMKYTCDICDKSYKDKSGLWYHNRKYHDNIISQKSAKNQSNIQPISVKNQPIIIQSVLNTKHSILECKYCNKSYKHIQSRWKHEQKCQVKSNNDQIMELKKEINELKEKINNTQQASNINNSHNTTNTNTLNNKGTINNNYIIAFGKEEINNILTEKEKFRILNARYKSLEESIKAIHFNKDRLVL